MIFLKFFEQRPIWTKAAIMYTTKISNDYARNILPAVGYYCTMGPWRTCWIKYGYNPLKESGSRIYQTLDFRIRTAGKLSKVIWFIFWGICKLISQEENYTLYEK